MMTKLKAFLVHLGISLLIFGGLLYIIVFHWYPLPFFATDGGWQGIRIVALVDIVLGPVLTLIVYKRGKPGLKFDLTVIALVQAGALAWGTWVVHHQRPVLVVFAEDRYFTVANDQLALTGVDAKTLKTLGATSPALVYAQLPDNEQELDKVLLESVQTSRPLYLQGERYRSMDERGLATLRAQAVDLRSYAQDDPQWATTFNAFARRHDEAALLYLPIHCRYLQAFAAVEPKTGAVVEIINIKASKMRGAASSNVVRLPRTSTQ